jgi:HEPN domain-containing protein
VDSYNFGPFIKNYVFLDNNSVSDLKKQLDYWLNSSQEDLDTADLIIREGKILHGLFFCQLAVEKALKAHVVKSTGDILPRSHNLIYLTELAALEVSEEDEIFFGILMRYQLEGRYPGQDPEVPSIEMSTELLFKTKKILKWIRKKLSGK